MIVADPTGEGQGEHWRDSQGESQIDLDMRKERDMTGLSAPCQFRKIPFFKIEPWGRYD
jgi:hypothetical protein